MRARLLVRWGIGLACLAVCIALGMPVPHAAQQAQDDFTVRVDSAARLGPFKPIYTYFGGDEPNYTYMQNGRKLVAELAGLSADPVYIRTHNLLTTGDGTPALKWGSTNA